MSLRFRLLFFAYLLILNMLIKEALHHVKNVKGHANMRSPLLHPSHSSTYMSVEKRPERAKFDIYFYIHISTFYISTTFIFSLF